MGGKNENYVSDGQKDNDVISTAYRCLLLRPISIVSGAFGQTRRKKKKKIVGVFPTSTVSDCIY